MGGASALAQAQRRALASLSRLRTLRGFYLAGGSAIAVHLGHRVSNDLGLFSGAVDADLERVADEIARSTDAVTIATTDAVLKVRLGRVPVDIVRYPYALLRRPKRGPDRFPIADLLDLAAMKLSALATRGLRRDFWDLHAILRCSRVTLGAALDGYVDRFGVKKADLYHVLRSLTYFDDAQKGPMPRGLTRSHWTEIEAFFRREAPRALRSRT